MSMFHAAAARGVDRVEEVPGIPYKVIKSLAAAMVPAHGFVVGTAGLVSNSSGWKTIKSKIWEFVKQVAWASFWAAAIAAGLLVYTSFTQKWKEKGYPTIPISALVAADQANGGKQIPLPGIGGATMYSGGARQTTQTTTTTQTRQTSLLDLDEYEG